jgi:hypothetical protein
MSANVQANRHRDYTKDNCFEYQDKAIDLAVPKGLEPYLVNKKNGSGGTARNTQAKLRLSLPANGGITDSKEKTPDRVKHQRERDERMACVLIVDVLPEGTTVKADMRALARENKDPYQLMEGLKYYLYEEGDEREASHYDAELAAVIRKSFVINRQPVVRNWLHKVRTIGRHIRTIRGEETLTWETLAGKVVYSLPTAKYPKMLKAATKLEDIIEKGERKITWSDLTIKLGTAERAVILEQTSGVGVDEAKEDQETGPGSDFATDDAKTMSAQATTNNINGENIREMFQVMVSAFKQGQQGNRQQREECRDFNRGNCNRGDRCKHMHNVNGGNRRSNGGNRGKSKAECWGFKAGSCMYGDQCRFSHQQ